MNSLEILKKYWGYNQFRINQEKIINNILDRRDTLAIMPTGGGKTLCYQIPALINNGICLVISPLISLMQDQISYLTTKGFISHSLNSHISFNESERILNNCIYGKVKFLYVTPEKLKEKLFINKIGLMKINLIAVDEAHCISQWGHDFRPAYRDIGTLREKLNEVPVLALTATANKVIAEDIEENLLFKKSNIIRSSLQRKNLSLQVNKTNDKKNHLIYLLKKIKSSAIVYVDTRRKTKEISNLLIKNNFSACYYHAGIEFRQKEEIQKKWSSNQIRIIVATSAFGMGINKKDVKLVVHLFLPSTIEEYFQQAGRAGRNGEKAFAVLLANNNDIIKQKKLFKLKYPEINNIKLIYENIASSLHVAINEKPNYPLSFNISVFCSTHKIEIIKLYHSIMYLEKAELIKLNFANNTQSKVKFIVSRANIYKFQIANKEYDQILQLLLRKFENILNEYHYINEQKIAKELNKTEKKVKDILLKLNKLEILTYEMSNNLPTIHFLKPRLSIENIRINHKLYDKRKKIDFNNLLLMIKYINEQKKCRSKSILEHFEEKLADDCGICDICVN
tara:strand:- start:3366 stop:5063 length:1698 start_codon:yes stop_codon:yes gene_type:complete